MRPAVLEFVRDVVDRLPIRTPVVELGARAATGQEGLAAELRAIVGADEHIGCDIQPGAGVDRIEDVHALTFADDSIGTVFCLDTLEHVRDPLRALVEMHRVLVPGGVVAISSVMFFPIHEHPWDFWRFTPEGFNELLSPFGSRLVLAQGHSLLPETVLGVGVKHPAPPGLEVLSSDLLPRSRHIASTWAQGRSVDFGPIRLTVRDLWKHTLRESAAAFTRRMRRPA